MINPNQFSNIPQLSWLYLSSNQISFIESNSFSNLNHSWTLNQRSNRIKTIEGNAFQFTINRDLTIKDQFFEKISSFLFTK